MTERYEFRRNGFKAQVAMFVAADTPERRENMDSLIMSLPLGAAIGITSLRVSGPALHVEIVPQLTADDDQAKAMLNQVQQVVTMAWVNVMEGDPAEIYWQSTVNEPLVEQEPQGELEGMSLPPTVAKILLSDPTKD